ncbi:hypothetical protein ES702_00432 [subsurface metagenome]
MKMNFQSLDIMLSCILCKKNDERLSREIVKYLNLDKLVDSEHGKSFKPVK